MTNHDSASEITNAEHLKRWRLILGKYAEEHLNQNQFNSTDKQISQSLDYLYQHEYRRRGLLTEKEGQEKSQAGGKESSIYNTVNWLNQSRKLFPQSTFERMQSQAIERYGLQEILNDPKAVRSLEPNINSLRLLMNLRGKLNNEMHSAIKDICQKVVDEILQKIRSHFIRAITGKKNRFNRSQIKINQNFDWRATIKTNLKHYDQVKQRITIEKAIFNSRSNRQLAWDIILCVDQSGSMDSSIIYSAVCASIIAKLPTVNLKLFVFDTQIVDLTHLAHDPVEVLMTVQLGGGTDIAKALDYAEQRITNPLRTVLVLISDFCEGGALNHLYNTVARINSERVKMLGLAALDENAEPVYDTQISQQLVNRGMHVAALTPEHFANWLAEVMQ